MRMTDLGEVTIFTDGGARGNPGPAGVGAVLISQDGEKLAEISRYIGVATNNVAEYLAVVYALQEAIWLGASKVHLKLDSQLVERQLTGAYKVKDQGMKKFFDLSLNLFRWFDNISIEHIPRQQNKDADKLVNRALDLARTR